MGSAWGVQFHPEYDRETAEWVVRGKYLSDDRTAAVLDVITDEAVSEAEATKRLFENFLAVVDSHQPVRGMPWAPIRPPGTVWRSE